VSCPVGNIQYMSKLIDTSWLPDKANLKISSWFNRKRKIKQKISDSYGKLKEEDYVFGDIRRYFDRNSPNVSLQVLSEKTCDDLNFEDLFAFVDRTSSRVGQQCLYNRMRRIPQDRNQIELSEQWVSVFQNDAVFRKEVQYVLKELSDEEAYYLCDLFQSELIKPPKWLPIAYLLSFTNMLALLLMVFTPQYILLFLGVTIVNMVIHYLNKKNLNTYLYSMPQLNNLNKVAKKLLSFNKVNMGDQISKGSMHVLKKINSKMGIFRIGNLLQGDPTGILFMVSELIKVIFLLEPIALFRVLKRVEKHGKELQEVFEFVGMVDEAISLASMRTGLPFYCPPEIIPSVKEMHFTDLYIPIIDSCVLNSIDVKGKSILITGSNMSGKTTFIRSVGINTIMALTLNTCFARTFAVPRFQIFSAILMNDDLMNDKSFYFEEVLTIKEMIDKSQSTDPMLFLLDEIYKGTNTVERVSGGKAVLSWLNRGENLVFISTHDVELTELLDEEYDLYHFSEQVSEQSISFDYKIKKGKLKTRNAIKILEVNGYPQPLIDEARKLSFEMDKLRQKPKV